MSDASAIRTALPLGWIASCGIAAASLLRGTAWLVGERPRTPLRVLCLMAFDTLHVFRKSKRLPARQRKALAALLDCGACVNAFHDGKGFSRQEYRATRRLLRDAGHDGLVAEYLARLRELEGERPAPGGDGGRFDQVRSYREDVVRLSLAVIASMAFDARSLEEGMQAVRGHEDLQLLFRIVMQCQVIDDVLDFDEDCSAGLPSFLTGPASLPEAIEWTRRAVAGYADASAASPSGHCVPLRVVLVGVSACTRLLLGLGSWRAKDVSCGLVRTP